MGLFQRISELLRSNINDLISRAEDPEKMLNAAIEDMQKQLVEAKSRVAMSIADEKRLQKQLETERGKTEDWEKKAMAAVRAKRDDLAIEALAKKKEHESSSMQFEQQYNAQKSAVDELKKALTQLTAKLEDTKRQRALLLARVKRANAQRQIAETMSAASKTSAIDKLDAMEEHVERQEAEAEANWELAAISGGAEDDLSKEIRLLESRTSNEDLDDLKNKMRGMGMIESGDEVKAALPSGIDDETAAQIEDDLADLKRKASAEEEDDSTEVPTES